MHASSSAGGPARSRKSAWRGCTSGHCFRSLDARAGPASFHRIRPMKGRTRPSWPGARWPSLKTGFAAWACPGDGVGPFSGAARKKTKFGERFSGNSNRRRLVARLDSHLRSHPHGHRSRFLDYVTEQVALGERLTHKKMFGEYALYVDGKVVAFACDNSVFVKPSAAAATLAPGLPQRPPYPGAKDYPVADELLDDSDAIRR